MNVDLATTVLNKARTMVANLPVNKSADVCLQDAEALFERADYTHCIERAERAILHSAGIFANKEID